MKFVFEKIERDWIPSVWTPLKGEFPTLNILDQIVSKYKPAKRRRIGGCIIPPLECTISFVTGQQVANQGVNVTSLALTFPGNVTNGNTAIVVVGCKSGTLADPTFTGTGFGTAVKLINEPSSGSAGSSWIFAIPCTGGAAALVLHCASAIIGACALEFSGVDTGYVTDGTNGNLHAAAGSQTTTPGSISTLNANDLIITVSDWVGLNTITTPPSGYTAMTQAQTTGANANTVQGYYEIVSSTTTTNPSIVLSTGAVAWVACIAALQAATVSGARPQDIFRAKTNSQRISYVKANKTKFLNLKRTKRIKIESPPLVAPVGFPLNILHKRLKPKKQLLYKNFKSNIHKFILLRTLVLFAFPLKIVKDSRRWIQKLPKLFKIHRYGVIHYIQPPASALGISPKFLFKHRIFKSRNFFKSLWHKLKPYVAPAPTGFPLKIVKDSRRWVQKLSKVFVRTAPVIRIKKFIQPPSSNLGIWLRVIKKSKRWIPKFPKNLKIHHYGISRLVTIPSGIWLKIVKDLRIWKQKLPKYVRHISPVLRLRPDIQPPTSALGIWLKLVKDSRRWIPKFSKPFKSHRYGLIRFIQPPAAKLGVWLHIIKKQKRWVKKLPRPLFHITFRKLLLGSASSPAPVGLVLKLIHRPRRWLQKIPKALPKFSFRKLLLTIQPPAAKLGVWLKIVKDSRRWIQKLPKPIKIHKYGLIRSIQPPALELGVWLRILKKQRRWIQKLPKAFIRKAPVLRLRPDIQPPSSNLGIWLKLVKDSRRWTQKLPKYVRHISPIIRLRSYIQPSASALGVWLHILKKQRRWIQKLPKAFIRKAPILRLRPDIQPPAAKLGVWIRILKKQRGWKPVFPKTQKVHRYGLIRFIQPPAAKLGIWINTLKKQRRWIQRLPKYVKPIRKNYNYFQPSTPKGIPINLLRKTRKIILPIRKVVIKKRKVYYNYASFPIIKIINILMALIASWFITLPIEVENPPGTINTLNITMPLLVSVQITLPLEGN